jgi:hypothetical protein
VKMGKMIAAAAVVVVLNIYLGIIFFVAFGHLSLKVDS